MTWGRGEIVPKMNMFADAWTTVVTGYTNNMDFFRHFQSNSLGLTFELCLWLCCCFFFLSRNVKRLYDITIWDYVIIWTLSNMRQRRQDDSILYIFIFSQTISLSRNERIFTHETSDLSTIINTLNIISIEIADFEIANTIHLLLVTEFVAINSGNLLLFIVNAIIGFRYIHIYVKISIPFNGC